MPKLPPRMCRSLSIQYPAPAVAYHHQFLFHILKIDIMKTLLLSLAALLSISLAHAQSASIFCVQVNCPQTITAPKDSILIFGAASINGIGDTVTSYQWTQTSGPAAAILVTPTASQTMVRKLVPGTYIFSLTVKTKAGNVQTVPSDVVTILAAPAPPRTVTGFSFQLINGVWKPSFTFSDGTTQ